MARVCSTSAQVGGANANSYVVHKTLSTLTFAGSAGSCRQLRVDNSCMFVASHHILQLKLNAPALDALSLSVRAAFPQVPTEQ